MAKRTTTYVCQGCGAVYGRWQGHCDACGAWNSIAEETAASGPAAGPSRKVLRRGRTIALVPLKGEVDETPRVLSGLGELDRVTSRARSRRP